MGPLAGARLHLHGRTYEQFRAVFTGPASVTWVDRRPVTAGERPRTGVNEPKTETRRPPAEQHGWGDTP